MSPVRMMIAVALCASACGYVNLDSVDAGVGDADDAAVRLDTSLDGREMDAPVDVGGDAPDADAAGTTGSCGPVLIAECPNVVADLGPGLPFVAEGILLDGHANNVDAPCFPEGGSDWAVQINPTANGRMGIRLTSAGRVAATVREGTCGGPLTNCYNPVGISSGPIAVGQALVVAVESVDACGVPFDLTLTYE